MRAEVAADIRAIFNAPDRNTAELYLHMAIQKFAKTVPRLSAWMEENLTEGFTVFEFPLEHCRFIRTTNSLERVNK
jgi:putative transposase